MIVIQAQGKEEIADNVFLRRPALRVGLGEFDRIDCGRCRDDGNKFRRSWGPDIFPSQNPR